MQGAQVNFDTGLASRTAPSVELAHILRSHGEDYLQTRPTSLEQRKVIRDITRCRTPTLGGHLETCGNGCGYERLSFHSCRNRHCPKCQNLKKVRWLLERSQKLLPTSYFHVVVTGGCQHSCRKRMSLIPFHDRAQIERKDATH